MKCLNLGNDAVGDVIFINEPNENNFNIIYLKNKLDHKRELVERLKKDHDYTKNELTLCRDENKIDILRNKLNMLKRNLSVESNDYSLLLLEYKKRIKNISDFEGDKLVKTLIFLKNHSQPTIKTKENSEEEIDKNKKKEYEEKWDFVLGIFKEWYVILIDKDDLETEIKKLQIIISGWRDDINTERVENI